MRYRINQKIISKAMHREKIEWNANGEHTAKNSAVHAIEILGG